MVQSNMDYDYEGDIMDTLFGFVEHSFAPLVIHFLEITGIIIIAYGSIKAIWFFILSKFDLNNHAVKLTLGEAMSLALEFKLGAEIIKTVIVRDLNELFILGFVVVLRIVLTFVIHWEIDAFNIEEDRQKIEQNRQNN